MPHETMHQETIQDADRARPRVGDMLRSRRLSRDEDLREVAQKLRIRYPYLEAIEEGRLNELPGPTYAIGFVRAYADYLGLATEDVVARFKADSRALEAKAELVFPEPLPGSRVPGFALLLVAIVLGGMVYGGWLYVSGQDRPIAEIIPAVPERLAQLIDGASGQAGGSAAPEPASDDALPGETSVTQSVPETADDATAPANSADNTVETPEQTTAPATTGDATPQTPASDTAASDPVPTPTADADSTTPQPPIRSESEIAAEAERAARQAADEAERQAATATAQTEQAEEVEEIAPDVAEQAADVAPSAPDAAGADPTPALGPETAANTDGTPATGPTDDSLTEPETAEPVGPVAEVTSVPLDATADEAAPEAEPEAPADPEPATQSTQQPTTLPAVPESSSGSGQVTAVSGGSETVFGAAEGDSRVSLTARVASWVEISASGGETLMARLLRAGETYRVPNRQGITMVTGNAGGLEIVVDGERVPDIGPLGGVRRNVALDPAKLKAGFADDG